MNPDNVLKEMNFLTDYNNEGLARNLVMKTLGHDVLPDEINKDMPKNISDSVRIIFIIKAIILNSFKYNNDFHKKS